MEEMDASKTNWMEIFGGSDVFLHHIIPLLGVEEKVSLRSICKQTYMYMKDMLILAINIEFEYRWDFSLPHVRHKFGDWWPERRARIYGSLSLYKNEIVYKDLWEIFHKGKLIVETADLTVLPSYSSITDFFLRALPRRLPDLVSLSWKFINMMGVKQEIGLPPIHLMSKLKHLTLENVPFFREGKGQERGEALENRMSLFRWSTQLESIKCIYRGDAEGTIGTFDLLSLPVNVRSITISSECNERLLTVSDIHLLSKSFTCLKEFHLPSICQGYDIRIKENGQNCGFLLPTGLESLSICVGFWHTLFSDRNQSSYHRLTSIKSLNCPTNADDFDSRYLPTSLISLEIIQGLPPLYNERPLVTDAFVQNLSTNLKSLTLVDCGVSQDLSCFTKLRSHGCKIIT